MDKNKPKRKKSSLFIFKGFFLLFINERHTKREAETRAEGEAGSMQGARRRTRFWVSRITPWAEGGAKPLSLRGCPRGRFQPWGYIHPMWVFKENVNTPADCGGVTTLEDTGHKNHLEEEKKLQSI